MKEITLISKTLFDDNKNNIVSRITEEGPYYTSYPTLSIWSEKNNNEVYSNSLLNFYNQYGEKEPVHLYIHIPYCAKLCWYCICNIEVTNSRKKIQYFLDYLYKEINLLAHFIKTNKIKFNITEIHLGGGTPSHLYNDQLSTLLKNLSSIVDFSNLLELTMEIDPRTTTKEDLIYYAELGIDRISFGIQDFNPKVQEAINRIQPPELIEAIFDEKVRGLFKGVNFDLLYGLPYQTRQTFQDTIKLVNRFKPDRITLLKYAHVPHLRNHMKLIKEETLPDIEDLPYMFMDAVDSFTKHDYEWIGIDNFALKNDDNSKARKSKKLWRTFNGFTPGRTHHMIGLGPTSTSSFGSFYFQSLYDHQDYFKSIDNNQFPIHRGHKLNQDEEIRREAIFSLLCQQEIDFIKLNNKYNIDFQNYFSSELRFLQEQYSRDDVFFMSDDVLSLTTRGRFTIRSICRIFDKYHHQNKYRIVGP